MYQSIFNFIAVLDGLSIWSGALMQWMSSAPSKYITYHLLFISNSNAALQTSLSSLFFSGQVVSLNLIYPILHQSSKSQPSNDEAPAPIYPRCLVTNARPKSLESSSRSWISFNKLIPIMSTTHWKRATDTPHTSCSERRCNLAHIMPSNCGSY